MPHAVPLDVVIGAPIDFDAERARAGGAPDGEVSAEQMVDSYHAQ